MSHNKLITNSKELQTLKHTLSGKLVATNGCFDVLHIGHVRYLRQAKKLGQYLIVGLNSDQSVKSIKGDSRPINTEAHRADLLSELQCVDYIYTFSESTADIFLDSLQPDIYVKGGDYQIDSLPEYNTIQRLHIEVEFIPLEQGFSSTKLISKLEL